METIANKPTPEEHALLEATVSKYVSPEVRILSVRELAGHVRISNVAVRRYELILAGIPTGRATLRLIIKRSVLSERRVFAHLNAQAQPNVPFSHTLDLTTDAPMPICVQDLGSVQRPTSLDPIQEVTLRQEVAGLAAIHAANWGHASDLSWLPRADRSYFAQMIEQTYWRPHWERIVRDPTFYAEFGSDLPRIEAAAGTIVEEMAALYNEADALTLVHTDINPGNVLLLDGVPYFIDWHAAHFGPCYLDVPHHFFTPALAEYYHAAMLAHEYQPATRYLHRTFPPCRALHRPPVHVVDFRSMAGRPYYGRVGSALLLHDIARNKRGANWHPFPFKLLPKSNTPSTTHHTARHSGSTA